MCKAEFRAAALANLVRLVNVLVALFGVALIVYAIYFGAKTHTFNYAAGVPLGLGLVDVVMGGTLATCGYRRLFLLRFYLLINGLLVLGEMAVAILFMVPSTQTKIIDSLALQGDVLAWVESNIGVAGYILISVVAVKAVAVLLVMGQSCAVNAAFREEDAEHLLGTATGYSRDKADKLITKGDKFGAFGDEGETSAAAARYRDRNIAMYEKYAAKRAAGGTS